MNKAVGNVAANLAVTSYAADAATATGVSERTVRRNTLILFLKADVKGHTRRLANGKIVTVKPYTDQRQKQAPIAHPAVSDPALQCSRYSMASRLPQQPMTVAEVQDVVDEFKSRTLPGNTALAFRVYATATDAFGPAIATYGRVKGAWLPQQRLFALAASHLSGRRDVEATLRHEVLAHYGLNLFTPETKRALLERLHTSQSNPFIAHIYRAVYHDYPGMDDPLL